MNINNNFALTIASTIMNCRVRFPVLLAGKRDMKNGIKVIIEDF